MLFSSSPEEYAITFAFSDCHRTYIIVLLCFKKHQTNKTNNQPKKTSKETNKKTQKKPQKTQKQLSEGLGEFLPINF